MGREMVKTRRAGGAGLAETIKKKEETMMTLTRAEMFEGRREGRTTRADDIAIKKEKRKPP